MLCKDDSRHAKDDMESIKKYQRVIPKEALATKDYKEFCCIVKDHFIAITHILHHLTKKVEIEKTILRTKSTELMEREKKIIINYINKVETDMDKWSKTIHILYKLLKSETRMAKVFNIIASKIEYKNT